MKKFLPLIAVAVILLVGLGAYMVMGKSKSPSYTPAVEESQEASKSSLKDLITKGGSQQCSFDDDNYEGKAYFSNKKMRGDFTVSTETKVVSHVIVDTDTMYTWTEGQSSGYKFTFNMDDIDLDASSSSSVDLAQEYNYKCSGWTPDSKVFVPPANIKFTSFTAPSLPAGANCSVCNSLQGDSKTQCLKALKC